MTNESKRQPVNMPDPEKGVEILNTWIGNIDIFKSTFKKYGKPDQTHFFSQIFRSITLAKHLLDKYKNREFGEWFLNLDNKCMKAFLQEISPGDGFDLTDPPLTDWKEINKQWGFDKHEHTNTEEEARRWVSNQRSKFDLFSLSKAWLWQFMLYANNNGISDEVYEGERFGNYTNWAVYYLQLSDEKKVELCKFLINYY